VRSSGGCMRPLTAGGGDTELFDRTLAILREWNSTTITRGPPVHVVRWKEAGQGTQRSGASRTIASSRSESRPVSVSIGGRCMPNDRGLRGNACKGQIRWVSKGDFVAQRQFIHTIFGIAA
jgi:hypothetical protein